jgi:nucleoside-diphosphate-sugar epimerase
MGKRVVVTGAAGFIGSNLSRHLLDKGYSVLAIDSLSSGTRENLDPRLDFHQLDVRDERMARLLAGADAVFHLAAKTSLPDCMNHPQEAASVNVVGTANVLEAARIAGVGKFVYADTSAEYEGIHQFPTPEDILRPISAYAASKHGGATFCESYRELYGMNVTMLRYFNVYGPAQDWRRVVPPVMSAFVIRMLNGERPIIYGSGEKRRDFIYVDDVNEFHLQVLESPASNGRVFNVGTGINYSVNQIYELIEGILQTGLRPIYKPDLPGEAEVTLADITESQRLGWQPEVSIHAGLERTIAYIQEKVLQAKGVERLLGERAAIPADATPEA